VIPEWRNLGDVGVFQMGVNPKVSQENPPE